MKKNIVIVLLSFLAAGAAKADIACAGVEAKTGEQIEIFVQGNPLKIHFRPTNAKELVANALLVEGEWEAQVLEGESDNYRYQPKFRGSLSLGSTSKTKEYGANFILHTERLGMEQTIENYKLTCKGQVSPLN